MWITFFLFFHVHNLNIFSPKRVEKIHLDISRKKPLFHISPPPTTMTTYYPILSYVRERKTGGQYEIFL